MIRTLKVASVSLLTMFACVLTYAQSSPFYYSGSNKVTIYPVGSRYVVSFAPGSNFPAIETQIKNTAGAKLLTVSNNHFVVQATSEALLSFQGINGYEATNNSYTTVVNGTFYQDFTNEIGYRIKAGKSASEVSTLNTRLKVVAVRDFLGSYVVKVSKGDNVLAISQQMYESGLFEYAYPNYLLKFTMHDYTPNDQLFNKQFYFNNTGQTYTTWLGSDIAAGTPGADIKMTKAWDLSLGNSNTVVAVIDEGIYKGHTDISETRLVKGKYFKANEAPTDFWEPDLHRGAGYHGTACAGIIGAEHNTEGIAGIAPNVKMMPIKLKFASNDEVPDQTRENDWDAIANAIRYAYQNGADIMSCSFGGETEPGSQYAVSKAINEAVTLGRNGKGTVMVFSAGNSASHSREIVYSQDRTIANGILEYPANYNIAGVIAVGASNRDDKQADYSPSSIFVDVVAPSHNRAAYEDPNLGYIEGKCVYTTDIPGESGLNTSVCPSQGGGTVNAYSYTCDFGGTSASAPQVAGVAALILDVNPNLTAADVENIIKASADKVGGYDYNADPSVIGSSVEMGAGRLNAYRAVKMAQEFTFSQTADLAMQDILGDSYAEPNPASEMWISPDIWIRNQNDGMQNQSSEPLVYTDLTTQPTFYVYVRVKNKGLQKNSGSEKLRLHWAKATASGAWPGPWTGDLNTNEITLGGIIDTKVVEEIVAGGEKIIMYAWRAPKGTVLRTLDNKEGHFCLLARLIDENLPNLGMNVKEEDNRLYDNIKNNNNIVQRNITMLVFPKSGITRSKTGCVQIYNDLGTPIELLIKRPDSEMNNSIFDAGQLNLKLDQTLFTGWVSGGLNSVNMLSVGNTFSVLRDNARLQKISIPVRKNAELCLEFIPKINLPGVNLPNVYSLDIIQLANGKIQGGDRLTFITQRPEPIFLVKESEQVEVNQNISMTYDGENISLTFEKLCTEPQRVQIYDLAGRELYKEEGVYGNQARLNFNTAGMCFGVVTNLVTGAQETFKFIIGQ